MAEPLSQEDMQARALSVMHQPVRIGDQLIGYVREARPLTQDQFYTGRFTLFVEGEDPFMPRQILDSVHVPAPRRR